MKDDIVEQTRKVREQHAAKFNYDLAAIFQDIKEQEMQSGRLVTVLPPKKAVQLSKKVG